METRGNIHLNKKFIKYIYFYGAIKDGIEIFLKRGKYKDAISNISELYKNPLRNLRRDLNIELHKT